MEFPHEEFRNFTSPDGCDTDFLVFSWLSVSLFWQNILSSMREGQMSNIMEKSRNPEQRFCVVDCHVYFFKTPFSRSFDFCSTWSASNARLANSITPNE